MTETRITDTPHPLQQWAERQGMSTRQLAELIGCSRMTVSGIINGFRPVSLRLIKRIYHVTGGEVAPNDILAAEIVRELGAPQIPSASDAAEARHGA